MNVNEKDYRRVLIPNDLSLSSINVRFVTPQSFSIVKINFKNF